MITVPGAPSTHLVPTGLRLTHSLPANEELRRRDKSCPRQEL